MGRKNLDFKPESLIGDVENKNYKEFKNLSQDEANKYFEIFKKSNECITYWGDYYNSFSYVYILLPIIVTHFLKIPL